MLWLDAWEANKYQMLVDGTARTCKKYLYAYQSKDSQEQQANTYNTLVLQGKSQTELC